MKKILIGLLILTLLGAGYWIYRNALSLENTQVIKIGYMGPLSGDSSSMGYSALKGVQFAKKDLSADNYEIITQDTGCTKESAAQGIQKLIDQGVVAIIGELCSGASLGALPIANKNKVVLISPASTSPSLSIEGDYFFRTVPSDNLQGVYASNLMYQKGYRKLAIIYTDEPYGKSFETVLEKSFIDKGGQVVLNIGIERGKLDFSSLVKNLKTKNPDVIFIVSNSTSSTVALLKQFKATNLPQAIYGSEAMNDEAVIKDAKEAMDGVMITAISTGNKNFKKAFRAEFGIDPGLFAPQSYDAFKTIFLATKDKPISPEQLKTALEGIRFEGVTGQIEFDKYGDISSNYETLTVQDGKVVPAIK
jgi:branched-chain amino acid transport system substrate-binding protein